MLLRKIQLLFILCLVPVASLFAAETHIVTGQGIEFTQVDFPHDDSPILNSAVGRMEASLYLLREESGMDTGYLNMVIDGDWHIRNMLVPNANDFPYPQITSNFDLGINEGTDVTSIDATVVFSDTLLSNAPAANPVSFSVGVTEVSQGGFSEVFGGTNSTSDTSPPVMAGISFGDVTNNRQIFQMDHPNIEAAVNQCYPMAIANSLQFLENTTNLDLPHSHVKGLRGDNSLVGQLGLAMNRTATSRTSGSGVNGKPGIQGKMKYLVDNGLQDQIQTRHWGIDGDENVSVTVGQKTATSTGQGTSLNFDTMLDALDGGENCEVGYLFGGGGGHFVDIAAAGYIAGQPFIIEASDLNQRDDTKGAGKSGFLFSFLKDTDNDGRLNMNGSATELALLICQKFLPPPPTDESLLPPPNTEYLIPGAWLDVTKVVDPAGHSCCVTPPPSLISLLLSDGRITVQSLTTIPWLPLITVLDALLQIHGTGVSTVAGYPDIETTLTGTLTADKITADISLGTDGGLPAGQAITYTVDITPDGGWPWLTETLATAVRVNGQRGSATVVAGEPISISIGIEPGSTTGEGEWYLVAQIGDVIGSFDLESGLWQEGIHATNTETLSSQRNRHMLTIPTGLPPGVYTFYFGVDNEVNGTADIESLAVDVFVLTVE